MRPKYEITLTRRGAALYLTMEYGIRYALRQLRKLPRTGLVTLPGTPESWMQTRSDAESVARRVESFVAYQQGRLRKPLFDCCIQVRRVSR